MLTCDFIHNSIWMDYSFHAGHLRLESKSKETRLYKSSSYTGICLPEALWQPGSASGCAQAESSTQCPCPQGESPPSPEKGLESPVTSVWLCEGLTSVGLGPGEGETPELTPH